MLGKLAVALAPPEPQLQHAALRLTPRGWETHPLPAPDGSGLLVVALDLREHAALVEHSDGTQRVVPLIPDRPVGDVTVDVVDAVTQVAGPVVINPRPQEVPWDVPLDEDQEHHTYDVPSVADYFKAATRVAMVLGELVPEALRYLRTNPAAPELSDYDHVVVDEYQDLNKAEQEMIDLLAAVSDR